MELTLYKDTCQHEDNHASPTEELYI